MIDFIKKGLLCALSVTCLNAYSSDLNHLEKYTKNGRIHRLLNSHLVYENDIFASSLVPDFSSIETLYPEGMKTIKCIAGVKIADTNGQILGDSIGHRVYEKITNLCAPADLKAKGIGKSFVNLYHGLFRKYYSVNYVNGARKMGGGLMAVYDVFSFALDNGLIEEQDLFLRENGGCRPAASSKVLKSLNYIDEIDAEILTDVLEKNAYRPIQETLTYLCQERFGSPANFRSRRGIR